MKSGMIKKVVVWSCFFLLALCMGRNITVAHAESEWKEKSYTLEAKNGESIDISVKTFKDETGLYWKETKAGLELYRKTETEDYQAIWGGNYILLKDVLYCIRDDVQYQGFVAVYKSKTATDSYWLYFGTDGKLQGDIRAHGLFDVESSGLYCYKNSELYKDIKTATIKWNMNYYESGIFEKEMKAKGWSDKKIKAEIEKRKKLEEAIYEDERSTEEVSAILNRTGSTGAGGWTAKIQNYACYNIYGHWEEMEQGEKKYWCDKAVAKEALVPKGTLWGSDTPHYVPLKKYDWITDTIISKQYIQNMGAEIGGKFYAFNGKGLLITNQWINNYQAFEPAGNLSEEEFNYEDYRFVGKDGTPVINTWVKMDGVKRHLGKDGYMETNQWVAGKDRGYWVNSDGKLDSSRTNAEYKIALKMVQLSKKYPQSSNVGACEVFKNKAVAYLYGNKSGKAYKYSWSKIKVGDTIAFSVDGFGHIGVVMAKNEEMLTLADSNYGGDGKVYYGRTVLYKKTLDKNGNSSLKNFEYRTYY